MNKKQLNNYMDTENQFWKESSYFRSLSSFEARSILDKLHRYEIVLHRINEDDCNGHPKMVTEYRDGKMYQYDVEDIAWEQKDRKKETNIQKKVKEIANLLGFEVKFNGDPRGGAIQFVLPSGKSNSWDNQVWGVYW